MSFNLQTIFSEMGLFALIVVGVLGLMAVAALAVFAERLWVFSRTRAKSLRFAQVAAKHLDDGEHEKFAAAASKEKNNLLASLLGSGIKAYRHALDKPSKNVTAVELTRRELERQADIIAAKLRRGLSVLASVGSVAPFVGLLGTVVGIIDAFQGIAAEGSGGLGAVSAGISEALIVTAIGLTVAIPAVLAFNFLSGKADSLELAMDQSRGEFVDFIEARHEGASDDNGHGSDHGVTAHAA